MSVPTCSRCGGIHSLDFMSLCWEKRLTVADRNRLCTCEACCGRNRDIAGNIAACIAALDAGIGDAEDFDPADWLGDECSEAAFS